MKVVATLAALGIASAALLAVAAPDGRDGRGHGAERFKQADTNGDGMLSRDEAKASPRLAKSFDEIDANRDGQLSADEMKSFRTKRMEARHAEHWKKLDANGDGRVSIEEARANAPRLAERFTAIDANGDGFVTPEEMKAAHAKHARK